jgi:hypothetical protein
MRRFMAALTLVLLGLFAAPQGAWAQTTTTTLPAPSTSASVDLGQTKSVIPRPNSGAEPQQMGDRGGSGQLALLGLLVLAICIIGTVVVRSTVRATRSRELPK